MTKFPFFSSSTPPRVVITGGTSGIGFEAVRAFLQAGARVVFCGRDRIHVHDAETQLAAAGEARGIVADITNKEAVAELIKDATGHLGGIDILINNAGVGEFEPFAKKDIDDIDRIIDTNIKGLLYTTHAALPHIASGGSIVNIASIAGLHGFANMATYSASKFAVIGFTEALARELKKEKINVYAICPGHVATPTNGKQFGLSAHTVAQRVLDVTGKHSPLKSGEHLTIY